MDAAPTIFVLGSGAVGFPLAAYLADARKSVIAVRTSRADVAKRAITVTVHNGASRISASVDTVSLAQLSHIDGTIVIAAKSYANTAIAQALKDKRATGPIVIMQNGVGVERPFLEAGFPSIFRCVLYITSQPVSDDDYTFRPVSPSPIGAVGGDAASLEQCVANLSTEGFPFRAEANIEREVWKKAIINTVFNSICPLLDVDNGIFVRSDVAADLARQVVGECVTLTDRLGIGLTEREIVEQLLLISRRSDGQPISTLQDIRLGRPTEIESLNLEIARIAASLQPQLHLPKVELLGNMIVAKSSQRRGQV